MPPTPWTGPLRAAPAAVLACVMLASFANVEMRLPRIALLAPIAALGVALLPLRSLPRPRPGLQLLSLSLALVFISALGRIYLFRFSEPQGLPLLPTIVGGVVAWALGACAIVMSGSPQKLLALLCANIPFAGVLILILAFASGTLPETNYWQYIGGRMTGGVFHGAQAWFALSHDALILLTFQVAAIPFALTLPVRRNRIAALVAAVGALSLLVLNGSVTYPAIAIGICVLGLATVRIAKGSSGRRPAFYPLLIAIVVAAGAFAVTAAFRPEATVPLIRSIANKDITRGHNVLDGREVMWSMAARHIADSPLVGYPLDEVTNEETRFAYLNPHNDYLLAALKFGIPATGLLILLMVTIAREFFTQILSAKDDLTRSAALAGFAAWLTLCLPSLLAGELSSPLFSNLALIGISAISFTLLRLRLDGVRAR
ncbi:MAG: O-antigen ligase family protein [Gemmatimonadota bacterium]